MMDMQVVLRKNRQWLDGDKGGERAELRWANLSGAELSGANLSEANLRWANLSGAELSEANLSGANLSEANLSGAELSGANLSEANLRRANLRRANLSGANLSEANLSGANLSEAILIFQADWINEHIETSKEGYLCYKTFGRWKAPADGWTIESGSVIRETVNANRTNACGSGVNVATLAWCELYTQGLPIWRCLIPWSMAAGIVVPYSTDGKFRTEYVQLLEIVS